MATYLRTYGVARTDVYPELKDSLPEWTHPAVRYYLADWRLIRDTSAGDKEVKDANVLYLPRLEGQDAADYDAYLSRATFYNFTGRTIGALVGTLFKRAYKIEALPAELKPRLETITRDANSFTGFAESAATEYLSLGRFGILVDLPTQPTSTPKPFLSGYLAENILDWDTEVLDQADGREVLTRVVLREFVAAVQAKNGRKTWVTRYRVLALEPAASGRRIYRQYIYASPNADATLEQGPAETLTPTRRGEPLDFIPFHILGGWPPRKPPMLDIARLNLSHYSSYALLEHGRFFTGLPLYYVETSGEMEGDFTLGPSRVWMVPQGTKPGLLEFNGQGLKFLENALSMKEAQAATLGGRMIGVTAQSTAETDNQTALQQRNEQAVMLTAARLMDEGFTRVLRWWAWMSNVEPATVEKMRAVFNKSFLYDAIGSREFRAIQSMYKDGILPIEVVYDYLLKANVIPDEVEIAEFKAMLDSAASFPNQPDFEARKEGYPNAQAKVSDEAKDADRELAQEELDNAAEQEAAAAKQGNPGVNQDRLAMQQRSAMSAPKPAPKR